MKYLRKYEEYIGDKKVYWLISTNPERAKKALKEIDAPVQRYDDVWDFNNWNDGTPDEPGVYILYDADYPMEPWSYMKLSSGEDWLRENGYQFMGNVGIENSEISAAKFNL